MAGLLACGITYAAEPVHVSGEDALSPYAQHTDVQLTELAAQWETLGEDQRRALLTEVKLRMAADKTAEPIITIKTRRRYGRTFRRSDGSVVRIERTEQVLQYRRPPTNVNQDGGGFGMGFERRAADRADPSDAAVRSADNPPVITVSSDPR